MFAAMIFAALLAASLAGCGGSPGSIRVNLSSVSATPRLQPGSNAQISITPSLGGFNGSIALGQTTVTFTDAAGNAKSSTPTAQSASGATVTLTFPVPAVAPTAPTTYQVTVQGSTSANQTFSSLEPVAATVYPAASITSLAPAASYQGQTVQVAITAANTDFVQGQTQATFGAGIAVNGAGSELPGLITVTGAGSATASLVIDPAAAIGTRTVAVTTQGQTATLTGGFTVQAALLPLVASVGGPYTGFSGRAVQFDGSKSNDPNGLALSYAWNFGDGATGTGVQPTHTYAKAGTFTVQLTLTDSAGLSATASTTATIATLVNPTASAGGPYTGTTGQAVSFDGSGSTDPNGSTLTYAWSFGDGSTGTGAKPTHTYSTAGTYTTTLTVTDTYNLTGSATATVTVSNPVQPPVANAGGPYTGTAGVAVSFNGSASSDPQSQTLTYAWDFGDGTTGSGARPTHTYANAGTYAVKLTVTNTSNLSNTATATATIAAAPKPPTAVAGGPYTGTAGVAVSFNGVGSSDPQGQTLTYAWSFGDGSSGSGVAPSHTYTAAGTYTVTLTVTDTANLTGSATATATIAAAPKPPAAVAGGPYTGMTGTAVSFNGAGSSDPQGQTLTYAWSFGDGSSGSGVAPSHTYTAAGTYTVTLTVTDTANLTGTATTTATISATPKPPTAVAGGPYTGVAGSPVSFNGSGSTDPQSQTLTYAWSFGDGGTGTGVSPSHTYATGGTYTTTLTVTDTSNLTGSATATVTISAAPTPPTAVAGGPYTGTAGVAVSFNGAGSSDPQGQALTYAWTFGDGGTGTGVSPTHTYAAAGTYTATLTVTDTSNLTGSATATVTIAAAATTPTANAGGPYTGNVGSAIAFNGSGSSDPRGETLTYAWDFGDGNTGTGVSPTHTYNDAQAYTVTLTVTNTDGTTATATTTATIGSVLQSVVGGPYTGNVNETIAFNGQASTAPGSDQLSYAWTFGDGGTATGATPTHTYTSAGKYTVSLTVTDTTTNLTNSSSTTATITAPPQLAFTSPAQGALFNTTSIQVAGTAATTIQTVTVNGVTATVSGGAFSATVPVRAGVNILTATGTDASGNVGTASTSVTVDLQPPALSVLQPVTGSTVTTQQIAVSGMVTDQVTGTVNANNVTVTVNGQAASVSNRSFLLPNLLLVPGANMLNLVATDAAGNSSTSTVQVTLASAAAQQHIVILSGNGQSGQIDSVLPQPLVVQLVSPTGTPVPNRAVTFTVTASDGTVESLPLQAQTLNLTTDAQGKASVLFQLGSRAGLGINQVTVTSPGFMGGTVFTETTTAGPPAYIHEFLGNNQRGIIGQPLAQAFQTIVQDTGGDPIAGVPVTFTVNTGDGLFAGQTATTVMTNSDGRAMATLTLGQQEGINNNTVTADFPNDTNAAVSFYASGFSSGAAANTSVSGIVLDNALNPVPNATASLMGTNLIATTDANGHFVLNGVPVGTMTLLVDGSTTSLSETLPSLTFILQALPGQNNTLNMPVYLPILDTASAKTVGGSTPVTLTMSTLPGVALTVAPNSVTFPDGTHVGQLTVSQVKSDLIPMPPPNGATPAFAWTIQPAGTVFSTPIAITIPNTNGLSPGQVAEFYQYDHDLEQFVSVGTLRVSPDGSVLNSDPGFGITKAGWSGLGPNPGPGGCSQSCDDNNACTDDHFAHCVCTHTPNKNVGSCFTNVPPGVNNCQTPGMCDPATGACKSKPRTSGSCDDGKFCTDPDTCQFDGSCRGTSKPPQGLPLTGFTFKANLTDTIKNIKKLLNPLFGADVADGFSADVSITGENNNVCCEATKNFVPNSTVSYGISGGISSPQEFLEFPPWSLGGVIPGSGYGLSANVGITLGGKVGVNVNRCASNKCASGQVTFSPAINFYLGANIVNPLTNATIFKGQVKAAVSLNLATQASSDCHGIDFVFGTNEILISFVYKLPLGGEVAVPLFRPVGSQVYSMGTLPIPDPLQ
jgi:PKD repeat protein